MNVGRVWRSSPGWMLAGYVLLTLALPVYVQLLQAVSGPDSPLGVEPVGILISVGLAWLVWCRSRLAWRVLVALTVWMAFLLVVTSDLAASNLPLWLVFGAHVALLLSPAVRTHVACPSSSVGVVGRGWRRSQTPHARSAEPGGPE